MQRALVGTARLHCLWFAPATVLRKPAHRFTPFIKTFAAVSVFSVVAAASSTVGSSPANAKTVTSSFHHSSCQQDINMSSFRAVRVEKFGDPSVLQVADVSALKPKDDEVLVKVMAAGVNPVETYIRAGSYARLPSLPFTPGNEGSGVVEAIGKNVTNVSPGQRVIVTSSTTGTYAQYCLAAASDVYALPDSLSFEQGAAVPIAYRTAYRALVQRARARAGMKVLVHGGSGGVGIATIQIARALGMKVFATAGSDEGMDLVKAQGAHAAFNHHAANYEAEIANVTSGHGVDVIIEMLANVNLERDLGLLAQGGTVAVVGNRGTTEINPRLLMLKESSVIGVLGGTKAEHAEAFAAITAGLHNGSLKPMVGHTFKLGQAKDAHVEVIEHKLGTKGKIVLQPWE